MRAWGGTTPSLLIVGVNGRTCWPGRQQCEGSSPRLSLCFSPARGADCRWVPVCRRLGGFPVSQGGSSPSASSSVLSALHVSHMRTPSYLPQEEGTVISSDHISRSHERGASVELTTLKDFPARVCRATEPHRAGDSKAGMERYWAPPPPRQLHAGVHEQFS